MTLEESDDLASEVVDAFASLYPKLALPFDVWGSLREMIQREILHRENGAPEGARSMSQDPLYIQSAIASGLRPKNGEPSC